MKSYKNFIEWKAAVKRHYPDATFSKHKGATLATDPTRTSNHMVGEWFGSRGSIRASQMKKNPTKRAKKNPFKRKVLAPAPSTKKQYVVWAKKDGGGKQYMFFKRYSLSGPHYDFAPGNPAGSKFTHFDTVQEAIAVCKRLAPRRKPGVTMGVDDIPKR